MSKIGVDIDEILSETVQTFLGFYNARHGTNFVLDEIIEYSFSRQFGISLEDEKRAIHEFFVSDEALHIPTLAGSIEAIQALSKENKLYAVSSRPTELIQSTTAWLNLYYPKCFTDVVLTNSHFDSTKTKSDVCRSLKLDIFIDDQIVFAEDCAQVCSVVYLLNKPWNQTSFSVDNIVRVMTWADILRKIDNKKREVSLGN